MATNYFHPSINATLNNVVVVTESNILGRVDRNLEVKLDFVCRTIAVYPYMFVAMTTEEDEEDCFGESIVFSCLFPLEVLFVMEQFVQLVVTVPDFTPVTTVLDDDTSTVVVTVPVFTCWMMTHLQLLSLFQSSPVG